MSNYDIAVIGAGVIGTSVAYHLTKAGMKVVLIEKGDLASGTSSHCDSVALICDKEPGIDTLQGYESIKRLLELQDELGYDMDFDQRGCLYVCEAEEEMVAAKRYVDAQVADGYNMYMLDRNEIFEREPYLARDLKGGFWSDPDCTVNPYKLCFGYVEKAKEMGMGMDVMPFTTVQGFKLGEKNEIQGVVTDKGDITCEKVFNCAGVWAPEIGKMLGLKSNFRLQTGNLVQQVGHDYLRTCNVVHHVQLPVPCFSRQQAGTAY